MSNFNNLNKRMILPVIMLMVLGVGISVSSGAGKRPPEPERIIRRIKIKLPQEGEKAPLREASLFKKAVVEKKPVVNASKAKVAGKKPEKVPFAASKAVPKKKRLVAKIDKPWGVHIASYVSRPDAEKAARRFKLSGYNSYTTEYDLKGVKWHRLRIGFYSSKGEAERYAKNLSKKFNLKGVWVVKPSPNEITSNIK